MTTQEITNQVHTYMSSSEKFINRLKELDHSLGQETIKRMLDCSFPAYLHLNDIEIDDLSVMDIYYHWYMLKSPCLRYSVTHQSWNQKELELVDFEDYYTFASRLRAETISRLVDCYPNHIRIDTYGQNYHAGVYPFDMYVAQNINGDVDEHAHAESLQLSESIMCSVFIDSFFPEGIDGHSIHHYFNANSKEEFVLFERDLKIILKQCEIKQIDLKNININIKFKNFVYKVILDN